MSPASPRRAPPAPRTLIRDAVLKPTKLSSPPPQDPMSTALAPANVVDNIAQLPACLPLSSSQPAYLSTQTPVHTDFPSSSAPLRAAPLTSVSKLATNWLPVGYLQSPGISLANNTRKRRAMRHAARLPPSTPYQSPKECQRSTLSSPVNRKRRGCLPKTFS